MLKEVLCFHYYKREHDVFGFVTTKVHQQVRLLDKHRCSQFTRGNSPLPVIEFILRRVKDYLVRMTIAQCEGVGGHALIQPVRIRDAIDGHTRGLRQDVQQRVA
jgi:hypothetical protein